MWLPPRWRGTTWSSVRSLPCRPQYWQVWRSRAKISRRVSLTRGRGRRIWCWRRITDGARWTARIDRISCVVVLDDLGLRAEDEPERPRDVADVQRLVVLVQHEHDPVHRPNHSSAPPAPVAVGGRRAPAQTRRRVHRPLDAGDLDLDPADLDRGLLPLVAAGRRGVAAAAGLAVPGEELLARGRRDACRRPWDLRPWFLRVDGAEGSAIGGGGPGMRSWRRPVASRSPGPVTYPRTIRTDMPGDTGPSRSTRAYQRASSGWTLPLIRAIRRSSNQCAIVWQGAACSTSSRIGPAPASSGPPPSRADPRPEGGPVDPRAASGSRRTRPGRRCARRRGPARWPPARTGRPRRRGRRASAQARGGHRRPDRAAGPGRRPPAASARRRRWR